MSNVLIVDENLLIRQGFRTLLDQEYRGVVIGEARNSQEAILELTRRRWDLVVLDSSYPNMDGLFLLDQIRKLSPTLPVLVISAQPDCRHVARARQMGATGFSAKHGPRADLSKAIRNVFAGRRHFDGFPAPVAEEPASNVKNLSPREYRVMVALGSGQRAKEIAAEMHVSAKTVSTYKRRLLDKLQLESIADLVRYAIEHHLL